MGSPKVSLPTLMTLIADLPQTVPVTIEAPSVFEPPAEEKALPQRRPPFVNAAADIAAIAAVSAPGTL